MRPRKHIENLIKEFDIYVNPKKDRQILDGLRDVQARSSKGEHGFSRIDIGRIIMNSKITKLVVASVIMIGIMYLITGSFDGSKNVYAMSDLPKLLYSAHTIHMKGTVYYADNLNPGGMISSDIEMLVDLENERWRNIKANISMDKNGTHITPIESVCDGDGFELYLDHNGKTASYGKLGDYGRKRLCRQIADTILYMTCGKQELFDLYRVVGEEEIDGELYEIWELVIENQDSMAMNVKTQSWLSPKTGDVDHVIIWKKTNGDWIKMADITTLDINIDVSDESFEMYVPDGYELTNTMETAHNNSIGGVSCGTDKFTLNGHILFVMDDGSIVACWSARKNKKDKSQADIFAEVEVGGQLPQLPCVVEGLKTSYDGQEIIYSGSHLGYTEKNGLFYEWGLYVTSDPVEHRMSHILPYELLYKTNGMEDASCKLNMRPEMLIGNSQDFDDFVIGAMKEFSDDGITPEISYGYVLELSKQLTSPNK